MSIEKILRVLDRAHHGPICAVKDWETRVIPQAVMNKLKKYKLDKTCNRDEPINCDDSLADAFYKAGFELAVELGMLCDDTERRITFSEEELLQAIKQAPSELELGEGVDKVVMRARKPEDKLKPVFCSPLAIVVSEENWVTMVQGIAQNKEIDLVCGPSLDTVFGRPLLGRTPYETLAGRIEAQMRREALWRAGRPGMPTLAVASSTTEYGQLGGFGIPGGYVPLKDYALILTPVELKTHYAGLHKVVHTINCGGAIRSATHSFIGGYSGPPEGSAVANIASDLLQFPVHMASVSGCYVYDIRYNGSCGPEALWSNSIVVQAVARNTHLLRDKIINQTAGPCTDMLLYESAVGMMMLSVSGTSSTLGPRSGGGRYKDHLSPLECKFLAEVFKASAGVTRKQANEIAKKIIPRYQDMLKDPPIGKKFQECYDLKEIQPTKEWLDIYKRVKRELAELGLPIEVQGN